MESVFSQYAPSEIGLIDYHGPNRDYARENVGQVNLQIESSEQRFKQHTLYNYIQKYRNIKTEMAGQLVRDLLSKAGGKTQSEPTSLIDTLKELFNNFFPDKKFLGPQPTSDGRILFPVELPNGETHDINELSSGEKEVLYGYLRIHNTAPKDSVLLLDEPELHLNPRLIRGLPTFYKHHLGDALNNQIWLITHSDAILREAIGEVGVSVFHMQVPHLITEGDNQVEPISKLADAERAIVDLVGDLATYRPGLKTVIFEGSEDSEFDVRMVGTLFPTFIEKINPISGGNKARVKELHGVLVQAARKGNLPSRFYSIVDRDHVSDDTVNAINIFEWNVYHIENYLLDSDFIRIALEELTGGQTKLMGRDNVEDALKEAAKDTLGGLVVFELQKLLNSIVIQQISIGTSPASSDPAGELYKTAQSSVSRLKKALEGEFNESSIRKTEQEIRKKLEIDLESGEWRQSFRGRDILKRFVGTHGQGISYEQFRNLILFRMRDNNFQPAGMKEVLDKILNDE